MLLFCNNIQMAVYIIEIYLYNIYIYILLFTSIYFFIFFLYFMHYKPYSKSY